jgi:hypothetical protein
VLGGELEIDSIDILQLVLEIERHFGIKLVQATGDALGHSLGSPPPSFSGCGSNSHFHCSLSHYFNFSCYFKLQRSLSTGG